MRILAMQSGTSADGIDIAVVDIYAEGERLRARVVDYREVPWDAALRERLRATIALEPSDAGEWTQLDTLTGQAFAAAAASVVAEIGPVDAVVSHGQTLFHWSDAAGTRGSLQIGRPAWIAERLGVPVVYDVRAADISAGGHGAPLMSFFDALWLADAAAEAGAPIVTVNLGGIANIQVVGADASVIAGDTGPANALLDAVVQRATGAAFDPDGALAASGEVDAELLEILAGHEYFAATLPKSTGRETFSLAVVDAALEVLGRDVAPADLLATLSALTVTTLTGAIRGAADAPAEVIVSGGGVRNRTLMDGIRAALPGTRVIVSDERGLAAGAREAVMFAVLGWLSLHGVPVCIADTVRIAGSLTLAAGMPKLETRDAITALSIEASAEGSEENAA